MGRGGDRRAAAAAAAAEAEEALRRGYEEVVRRKDAGDMKGASDLALTLVDAHPKSPVPYNLVGWVMEGAAAVLKDRIDKFSAQDPAGVQSAMIGQVQIDRFPSQDTGHDGMIGEVQTDRFLSQDTGHDGMIGEVQTDRFPSQDPARVRSGDVGHEGIIGEVQTDRLPSQDTAMVGFGDAEDAARIEDRAARRAKEIAGAMDELAAYLQTCAQWYRNAADRAPRCLFTRATYARSLAVTHQTAAAYHEYKSALKIHNPDLPQKNNPWVPWSDQATDKERKASALAKAHNDFRFFMHCADSSVYLACRDMLAAVRNGQGTTAQAIKDANVLADQYPFSARANLLGPFLKKSLIESSTSSVTKLKSYQQLLRDIAGTMDLFPSSIVMSLFRAEMLYSMGSYLEASVECIRGLKIRKPNDPVSEDVPPGWASGSGPTARIAAVMAEFMDLLERIEEQISDPNDIEKLLDGLCLESKDAPAPAANNRGKRLVDNLNLKLLQNVSNRAADPDSIQQKGSSSKKKTYQVPSKRLQHRNRHKNTDEMEGVLLKKDQIEDEELKEENEEPRPQQVMANRIVPSETVDTYAEYCSLRSMLSDKKYICHLCVFEEQLYYTNIIRKGNMHYHCRKVHKIRTIQCGVYTCDARFRTEDEKELHEHYCHLLDRDWWRLWQKKT